MRKPLLSFYPYTYDQSTGRLYLRGKEIRIPMQDAKALNVLLRKPGQLVSRETLCEELWPGIVGGEFKQSINKIISQLRSTLHDDSRTPRFIETLPRRGYRFVAEVGYVDTAAYPPDVMSAAIESLPGVPAHGLVETSPSPVRMQATALPGSPTPSGPEDGAATHPRDPGRAALPIVREPEANEPATRPNEPAAQPSAPVVPVAGTPDRGKRALWLSWIAVCVVILALGTSLWQRKRTADAAPTGSIFLSIPPFQTDGAASGALAETFRTGLSDRLSLLPGIRIRAFHSFSASPRDTEFMRSLPLQRQNGITVLGSLRKTQDQDRCSLDLEVLRGTDASQLALLHYQTGCAELSSLQKQVQRDLISRVNRGDDVLAPKVRISLDAYLEGRRLLSERTTASLQGALAKFHQATDDSPRFSPGLSGMATTYLLLADRGVSADGYTEARRWAERALEVDPANAEAHAVLGCVAMSADWHSAESEASLRRAIALDGQEATYHLWLASLLNAERRFDEAMQQIQIAKEDDPYWPPVYMTEVMVSSNAGLSSHSIQTAKTLTSLTPLWPFAYDELAWAQWYAKRETDAVNTWKRMSEISGTAAQVKLSDAGIAVLAREGPRGYASWRLQHATEVFDSGYHSPALQTAEWQAYAGREDDVRTTIEAMVRTHSPSLVQVLPDPPLQAFVHLTGLDLPATH